ncbi:sugar O-acetyltransferase [Runella sp.]|jgi:acetyltransferase-like isoleucine patch superfamily enzyme|uniref:sugar O-acetyltransferase n=1 Tax=Runella sp. TaxID=1960881 RepID=UPI00301617B9
MNKEKDIFERMLEGGIIRYEDPQFPQITEIVNETMKLSQKLNASTDSSEVRQWLSKIIGKKVEESTTVFIPFHTNFGRFINIGENVFINHGCSFLDLGGITIEDDVLIGPNVQLITENHPIQPTERKALDLKSILIKRNAWVGAGAIILPGVTVGENSVVAAGAVVTKDVPDNTVVAGVPAKVVKIL